MLYEMLTPVVGMNIANLSKLLLDATGEDVKIMQFTGFVDMNGKEIYNGDIIRYTGSKSKGKGAKRRPIEHFWEVVWYQKKGVWYTKMGEQLDTLWGKALTHDVVGNVYENPELLK